MKGLRLHQADAGLSHQPEGCVLELDGVASRHAMVRRVQPGDALQLFDGRGTERAARVLAVSRHAVRVELGARLGPAAAELVPAVTLAIVVPANERMDMVVEKAGELGAAAIQPLLAERSVLRLAGERALRKREHWQAIAVAACEQCGRAVVPPVHAVQALDTWLAALPAATAAQRRVLLSLAPDAAAPGIALGLVPGAALGDAALGSMLALSGPEGGFAPGEEAAARRAGFVPVSLGPRVLRADTAPLALLAWLGLQAGPAGPEGRTADMPP